MDAVVRSHLPAELARLKQRVVFCHSRQRADLDLLLPDHKRHLMDAHRVNEKQRCVRRTQLINLRI